MITILATVVHICLLGDLSTDRESIIVTAKETVQLRSQYNRCRQCEQPQHLCGIQEHDGYVNDLYCLTLRLSTGLRHFT